MKTGKRAIDTEVNSINYCFGSQRIYDLLESLIEQMDYCMQLTFENQWQRETIYLSGSMQAPIHEITVQEYEALQKGTQWAVREVNMELWGMKLQVAYDADQLYEQAASWQRMIVIVMGVLLFLSMVISYYISRNQSEKIYRLRESLQTAWTDDQKQYQLKPKNEFDYMHAMVNSIVLETGRMRREAESAKRLMRRQGAMLLFYGGIREESAALGMLESCGVELQDSFFAVMCVTFMSGKNISDKVLEQLTEDRLGYVGTVAGRKTVIALVELSSEDYMRKQRERLGEAVRQETGSDVKIAFSRPYENIMRASAAYQEATMVCGQLQQTAGEDFGCADTWIKIKPQIVRFEEQNLTELENAVSEGQRQRAREALDGLLVFADNKSLSEENRKYLRYCIIQSILLTSKNMEKQDIRRLSEEIAGMDLNDGSSFAEKIRWVLDQACPAEAEEREKIDFARVVEYISKNYQRYDLSLDEVADFAGLSKAYMSRLFKEKTGSRYIDYLTACRMEQAKRLLLETDMSMKQVAEAVGYSNVPGFRNKFKNHFGINGAEIRRKHRSGTIPKGEEEQHV